MEIVVLLACLVMALVMVIVFIAMLTDKGLQIDPHPFDCPCETCEYDRSEEAR